MGTQQKSTRKFTNTYADVTAFGLAVILGFMAFSTQAQQGTSALSPFQHAQQQADLLFDEGKFEQALPIYVRLATQGDYFSQYRLAVMHQNGLGTDADLIEAYAWASLATQSGNPKLHSYRTDLRKMLGPNQDEARERARNHGRKYGELVLAQKRLNTQKKILRGCTGSRLGTTCQAVHVAGRRVDNTRDPGCRGDDCFLSLHPELTGLEANGGVESLSIRGAMYYGHVYEAIRAINAYIEDYIALHGNVTIGDFKVLEPDEEESDSARAGEPEHAGDH